MCFILDEENDDDDDNLPDNITITCTLLVLVVVVLVLRADDSYMQQTMTIDKSEYQAVSCTADDASATLCSIA